ncbi:ATP-binding cassette domain-containing protein [Bombella sp. TMW 2.2559]|uniref:ATP-binding cassette domain-containing protein n=1 Tax=Bombella dulcis TaxID=2967339 RepID=A0ABT3WF61_9PROT|nr:ATP-binding cassette domain-containing protein [Bombella dulcis]MCX5616442.1 ATP-binding cassette domain-containing protein [Bombella dulcis]
MKKAHLACHDVSFQVGRHLILNHATLDLPLKGLTILRGRNGAGKTCFLRALMGLLPIQGGTLLINNLPPAKARHHCGYMPQRADETAPMLPVISHVMACLKGTCWGLPHPGRTRRKTEQLLAEVDALPLADRPLGVLSGGERQRVALAQALANSPGLLILDEPFAALDHKSHDALLQLFTRLHQQKGMNLLITAHGSLSTKDLPLPVRDITLREGALHV